MRGRSAIALGALLSLPFVANACGGGEVAVTPPQPPAVDVGTSKPDDAATADADGATTDARDEDTGAPIDAGWRANGIKDADESDIDCGGASAPRCEGGKKCASAGDCRSSACRDIGVCAFARSCLGQNGAQTCGPSGTDDCCRSLKAPRPGSPYELDKYVVTAGRFRAFVEATSGNLRGWIQSNTPSWWDPVWDAWIPNTLDDGTYNGKDGVYQQLGPGLYFPDAEGNLGCYINGIGARTYWVPQAINEARWNDPQSYDQPTLDRKPLQCATFMMAAAFCAWDGGRVATLDELDYAWNEGDPANYLFPWGNSPPPGGWEYAYATEADALSFGVERCNPWGTGPCDKNRASWRYNSWTPAGGTAGNDRSIFIPPPGRYPSGDGPFGHSDLAGLVFTVSSSLTGAKGDDPVTRQSMWSRSGSWQGHGVPFYHYGGGPPLSWSMASKYWSTGVRCAR